MNSNETYSDREWLNKLGSHSTGSVIAYHGPACWNDEKENDVVTMVEFADCRGKVRLHKTKADSIEDFINKLETINSVIVNFKKYLESIAGDSAN